MRKAQKLRRWRIGWVVGLWGKQASKDIPVQIKLELKHYVTTQKLIRKTVHLHDSNMGLPVNRWDMYLVR
jgi:hypothetical protein